MSYGEYFVEKQGWARWPRVLVMCRKRGRDESGNLIAERRRYVPEGGTRDDWNARVRETLRRLEDARKRYDEMMAEVDEQPNLRAEIDGLKWAIEERDQLIRDMAECLGRMCDFSHAKSYEVRAERLGIEVRR